VASAVLGSLLAACAAKTTPPRVDLEPARRAVEAARNAGASETAETVFTRAVGHLTEAESLAASPAGGNASERSRQAEALARLAMSEAQCAESMARLPGAAQRAEAGGLPGNEADKLRAQLRQAGDEQRRLQERITLLQRDLDVTETEVIRTKAKLKGIETKAEASSAIAEARILMRRVGKEKGHSASLVRCQENLDKAEQQLRLENFGAAAFFASLAQEALDDTRRASVSSREQERPPPKPSYVAKPAGANVRRGPAQSEPLLGKIPGGASVEATAINGDWLKVRYGELVGWAYAPLFE
jgi:hypothetical protein